MKELNNFGNKFYDSITQFDSTVNHNLVQTISQDLWLNIATNYYENLNMKIAGDLKRNLYFKVQDKLKL